MSSVINDQDSIISGAPEIPRKNDAAKNFSGIPKPFQKLTHLLDPISSTSLSTSPKSPALVSPHNRAWIGSPGSFIDRIPESNLLAKCTAFVDVWAFDGKDNRSKLFSRILNRMGATIAMKFTKNEDITHLVFKEGHKSYLQKAKKRNIKIVTCMWVEKCRTTQTWVNEIPYIFDDSNYVPPKKFREMQPLEPEEERLRSAERARRRQMREDKKAKKAVAFLSPLVYGDNNIDEGEHGTRITLACDTPYQPSSCSFYRPRLVSETPSESILRKLQRMKEGKPIFSPPSSPVSDISDSDHVSSHVVPKPLDLRSDVPSTASNVIPSSQGSDMDLTCIDLEKSEKPGITEELKKTNRFSFGNKSSELSSHDEDNSGFQLQLSNSSRSFEDLSLSHSRIEKENSLRSSMEKENSLRSSMEKENSLRSSMEKENAVTVSEKTVKKRARRKLCDDDILKPASLLLSPKPKQDRPVTPRRSRRLSSKSAMQATSLPSKPKSVFEANVSALNSTANSSCSTLPPPGQSIMKAATKRRFFDSLQDSPNKSNDEKRSAEKSQLRPSTPGTKRESLCSKKRTRKDSAPLVELSMNQQENAATGGSRKRVSRVSGKKSRRKKSRDKENISKSKMLQELLEAPKPRRSTDEFLSAPIDINATQKQRRKERRRSLMVLTSLHSDERIAMTKIVRRLGSFRVCSSVKENDVSHVICGAARRTLNVLHAIARGLWLLSKDWLFDSMRAGQWLDEDMYEVDYFPSAKEARLQRSMSPSWTLPLFQSVKGNVFISPETEPPTDELRDLVVLCGGHVTRSPRRAVVRVGRWSTMNSLSAVKETWILDSITEITLKPIEDYSIS